MIEDYKVRNLGAAILELHTSLHGLISFSDFCSSASTIEFDAHEGFLNNSLRLFRIAYPNFELEAKIEKGAIFIRRNGIYQHSEQYTGKDAVHVVCQWDIDSIACGIAPHPYTEDVMNQNMRAIRTKVTVPPIELVKLLRTEGLLFNKPYEDANDLFSTVLDCLHLCEVDIRRHGSEKFVWGKGGDLHKPMDEPDITRYVASFLSSHGAARNFDVICEPIAGSGKLDFYVVGSTLKSGLAKIAIEAKKADNSRLCHGLKVQLPEYMERIQTQHGIYLVYWLKSQNYPYPKQSSYPSLEIEVLHPIQRMHNIRTLGIDLSLGYTPSKQGDLFCRR